MKILVVSYYPIGFGGGEVSMKLIAAGVKNLGHNIVYASTGNYEGFKTYKFKQYKKMPFFFIRDIYLTNFLVDIIKKENIQIVHANDFYVMAAVLKAAKRTNIKSVASFRDYAFVCVKST